VRRRIISVAVAAAFTVLWAALCNLVLNRVQDAADGDRYLQGRIDDTSVVFLISTTFVWLVLLGLVAVTGRVLVSAALLAALTVAVAFANHEKLTLRREPIYPSDLAFLGEPGFLTEMVGLGTLLRVVLGILVGAVLVYAAGRLLRSVFPPIRSGSERRTWFAWVAVRVVLLVVAVAGVGHALAFNADGNRWREAYVAARADWMPHAQFKNYLRHGFVAGWLFNTHAPAMAAPEGYSEATMEALVDRWTAAAAEVNEVRRGTLDDVNVVVVLSESFSDPTLVDEVTFAEDPIPYTRRLMSRTRSGQMLTQFIGGGTANMEFETLTGLSMASFRPQMNTPYQMLVPETPSFPSAAEYFARAGHEPIGIHPYLARMYRRDVVYPKLGFSRFLHKERMQHKTRIDDDNFISDSSTFDEALMTLEQTPGPAFLNVVTMQNHIPLAGKFEDPIPVRGEVGNQGRSLSAFARGLAHSDAALRGFLESLEDSPERTAVVFYGDHAPAYWLTTPAYEGNERLLRQTPFFLWTNYEKLAAHDEGLISPVHFLPMLFESLEVPGPPLYALLDELRAEVPAMAQGELHLPDGTVTGPDGLDEEARSLLHDYRLLQYDVSVGRRHALEEMFYSEP
jgi:phosphoglycerol transferase MdoB-like AlkP superfamily enzyme